MQRFSLVEGYVVILEHEIQVHMEIYRRGQGVGRISLPSGGILGIRIHGDDGVTIYISGD